MKQKKISAHKNGTFSNSIGFILACVGSAVGLGNIWMFPYRLGQYGGAAFLIPYLFFILLFGLTGLSAEFGIGRLAQTGTLGAYDLCWKKNKLHKLGKTIGWIPLLGSLGIATGYSIIIGWVLRSLWGSFSGELLNQDSSIYFSQATGDFGSLPWHVIVIFITLIILLTGSTLQIERANKIMMPIFFLLFTFLAIRSWFLPGSIEGYKFLFIPKWDYLLQADTWIMAMGQAFFSLSITGSGMIVYGSYLSKNEDIPNASFRTAFFDTIAALLSALAIMPAVFAFQIEPTRGPSLMFITIPQIFQKMPFGQLFAIFFFLSVTFAGITSLINMFEAVIESLQNRFQLNRKIAVLICGTICLSVGIFLEAEPKVGSFMDFITIIVVPFGAVFGAISIYYALGKYEIEKELNIGRKKNLPLCFGKIARYIYVPLTIIIFILGLIYKGIG
ncbi:sodium-dependent transporter [Velocimicrobium porci]|nr:sodium-dependent transporter [Velocimicrobium porci]